MTIDGDPTRSMDDLDSEEADEQILAALPAAPGDAYEVRREIAHGGMGVILEAWDARHGRVVAIKTLRRPDPAWVQRFLREVRLTAALAHPSIIPLYEAGIWPSGEPFYAMRLVEGQSLAKAVEGATTSRERLSLLPHLIALTEALAYAHERGIIHRDLKPSNVLVGRFGETVVIDWGLAKRVGEPDTRAAESIPPPGLDATLDGAVLGTLHYMAPEQARGERVDARADVYALGALAYHVLSGSRPYGHATSVDTILRVAPDAIGVVAPDVPRDLCSIVAKAMARDPEHRYPSAKELALDLRAFATGRLVSAQSYSSWTLLRRWVARHRLPVTLAAVFIGLLAVTVALSVTRIVHERQVALGNQDAAEKLVSYLLRELRDKLERVGRLDVLSGLGAEVEAYYAAAVHPDGAEPTPSLMRRADALDLWGHVEQNAGRPDAALDRLARAQALYRQAVERDPEDVDARDRWCRAISYLGDIERERTRLDAAGERFRAAMECARGGIARHPASPALHRTAANILTRMGSLAEAKGKWDDTRALFLEARGALAEATRLGGRYPSDEAWLAEALARTAWRLGMLDEAIAEGQRAVVVRRELHREAPDDSRRALELVTALDVVARTERNLGRWVDARAHVEENLATMETLAARDPKHLDWQYRLQVALAARCAIEIDLDELAAARPACERALAIGRRLAALEPDRRRYLGLTTTAAWLSGGLALAAGDLTEARRLSREANESARKELAVAPGDAIARQHDLMAAHLEGRVELLAKRGVDAARAFRRAIAISDELATKADSNRNREELVELLLYLGDGETLAGEARAARDHFERAHELAKQQAEASPRSVDATTLLAKSYLRLAPFAPDPPAFRDKAKDLLVAIGDGIDAEGKQLLRSLSER